MSSSRAVLLVVLTSALGSTACGGKEASPLEPTVQPPAYSEWLSRSSEDRGPSGQQEDWGDTKKSSCRPLRPATASKDIGISGGALRVGPHTLVVPPGALLQTTRITGRITSDSVNSIQFFPEGLHFVVPAILGLSYDNCETLNTNTMKVVYTSNDLVKLMELVPSEDRKLEETVVGFISHFSRYAVAY